MQIECPTSITDEVTRYEFFCRRITKNVTFGADSDVTECRNSFIYNKLLFLLEVMSDYDRRFSSNDVKLNPLRGFRVLPLFKVAAEKDHAADVRRPTKCPSDLGGRHANFSSCRTGF